MRNLTARGWIVLVIIPALIALWVAWEVAGHLWYVGDGGQIFGYCWGSMTECYKRGI